MKTILVADDEFDMLNALQIILEEEGYRVVTCSNGQDALTQLNMNKPDLLITDVMMPRLSGFDLLAKINGDENLRSVPTIVMSAVRHAEMTKQPSASLFLPKPFTIEQLLEAVKKTLA